MIDIEMFSQEAATRALVREARKETIVIAIKRFRKMDLSDEDILKNIIEDYDLSKEKAREYLAESLESNKFQERLDDINKKFKDIDELLSSQNEQ